MTPKKLQKLCYYAQAWNLALNNRKIINDDFEAWVHGPVNRKLYGNYKRFGWSEIPSIENHDIQDKNDLKLLESVWVTYGEYDGHQLEELTHRETPWINARIGLQPFENSQKIISDGDMAEYYRGIYIGG